MRRTIPFLFLSLFILTIPLHSAIPDAPFTQEYHVPYPIGDSRESNDVRCVAVDHSGNVWAGTRMGLYLLPKGESLWRAVLPDNSAGPVFALLIDAKNTMWIGAWDGIYKGSSKGVEKIRGIDSPISTMAIIGNEVIALGPQGKWRFTKDRFEQENMPYSRQVRAVCPDGQGGALIATGRGLYHQTTDGISLYQSEAELFSADVRDIILDTQGKVWIVGLGGVTVYQDGKRVQDYVPKDGLASVDVRCVAQSPDGSMWFGTDKGISRFDGKTWSLRHSRRWLLNDAVRDIAFDDAGTAWIATGNGVSAIKNKILTLEQKARHFQRICAARHVREPFLVEKCLLTVPGDTASWQPRDDDNDGQYTSMYLAMESFRFAATGDARARANAKNAFEALRFLQIVTETPGFVARTVIPSTWTHMADPNRSFSQQEWADMIVENPREKRVAQRWRPSRDGKWLWKGDTSSDEITGHMFGYLFYHDLVADETEKQRVREHVCNIVDYIIDGGYVLRDIDGTHTLWGVWSPEKLNRDPDWQTERGINSVEILSYLKLAHHVSGDERYQKEYLKLLYDHHYAENVRQAKTFNPAWITHIDDELLALAYPCLLLHEDDPALLALYRESLDLWYSGIEKDASPYFNFTYAALTGQDANMETSIASLRDTPLDLVRWRMDNTAREDIEIVRYPELESLQTSRLLPPSERALFRWDNNPWNAVQGDGGHTESDGVFWLLPYWMGRYYDFIEQKTTNYLFSYFKGNGEDGLHLAYSYDGLNWTPMNDDRSFLTPKLGKQKLMRDPCIIQGPDSVFHLVWTTGWWENGIGIAHSKDLITWSDQKWLPVMAHEPSAKNCWAPEIFYDDEHEEYLIFWSTTLPGRFPETETSGDRGLNHRIYCTTTKDFVKFSATRLFYDPGFNAIDATLVKNGDQHLLFLKDETRHPPKKHLRLARSNHARGPYGPASKPISPDWVEGPTAVKIGEHWMVYFDEYTRHRYGTIRSTDLKTWEPVTEALSFPDGARHGTILTVSDEILEKLLRMR